MGSKNKKNKGEKQGKTDNQDNQVKLNKSVDSKGTNNKGGKQNKVRTDNRPKRSLSISPSNEINNTPGKIIKLSDKLTEHFSSSFIQHTNGMASNIVAPGTSQCFTPMMNHTSPIPGPIYNHSSPVNTPIQQPMQNTYCMQPPAPVMQMNQQQMNPQNTIYPQPNVGVPPPNLADMTNNQPFIQCIQSMFDQLENRLKGMDAKLSKLDNIETQITQLNTRMITMEGRVISLETETQQCNKQLVELQASRAFDAQTCDEIKSSQTNISKQISDFNKASNDMSQQLKSVSNENDRLKEQLLDLQSRSMRDNLLFFNISECQTREERSDENCIDKIHEFCESKLEIYEAKNIKIDRAHRLGPYKSDKTRPIVVKFNYFQDKMRVKQEANTKLRDTDFRVTAPAK